MWVLVPHVRYNLYVLVELVDVCLSVHLEWLVTVYYQGQNDYPGVHLHVYVRVGMNKQFPFIFHVTEQLLPFCSHSILFCCDKTIILFHSVVVKQSFRCHRKFCC